MSLYVSQEPTVCAYHGAHEPVCVVRGQQRAVAGVVRAGSTLARHAERLPGVVLRAQHCPAVRNANYVHVDAVRGTLPTHRAS